MDKNIIKLNKLVAAIALAPFAAAAQTVPAISQDAPIADQVLSSPVVLNDKERAALNIVREWKKNPDKPRKTSDGGVKYLFGATLPTLVCTPLQVCAIRLQAGETVNDVNIGDSTRWEITPAMMGTGPDAVVNAIVKPSEPGLKTNVIITTDRRVYTIQLKSAKHEWMPSISFAYPDDQERAWANYRSQQARAVHASTLSTGENAATLDFNYRMSGDNPKWKPQRIYSDGTKTYIQFPSARFADEAPALVALGKDDGWFSDPAPQLVNYRLIGDRFVVDQVLDRAALISGVGSSQVRVEIEHTGESK